MFRVVLIALLLLGCTGGPGVDSGMDGGDAADAVVVLGYDGAAIPMCSSAPQLTGWTRVMLYCGPGYSGCGATPDGPAECACPMATWEGDRCGAVAYPAGTPGSRPVVHSLCDPNTGLCSCVRDTGAACWCMGTPTIGTACNIDALNCCWTM